MADKAVLDTLVDLVALDYDAIDAYDQAIQRLKKDEVSRRELASFKGDHERHVRDLSPLIRSLGGEPPKGGDIKRFLTQGKVVLATIAGDVAILKAMKSNEDTTNQKYEESLRIPGITAEIRTILERNLSDERRHRTWIESRIGSLERAAA